MVELDLLRLADRGQGEYPATGFSDLAASCREAGRSKPRLLLVAESIDLLAEAWGQFDALPTETCDRIDSVLKTDVPLVLHEPDEQAALALADSMREEVLLALQAGPRM